MTSEHNNRDLRKLAEEIINGQSTMTLATAKEGVAWAAPVYYVYLNSRFYFFSDPESRHIRESLENSQASAAIYGAASTWQKIRGIQMSGSIGAVSVGPGAVKIIRAYLKKFAFTTEFFESSQPLDLAAFTKRFKVRLYTLEPSLIYYLDNSIRFGFREKVFL
jgi:hypothetical protein